MLAPSDENNINRRAKRCAPSIEFSSVKPGVSLSPPRKKLRQSGTQSKNALQGGFGSSLEQEQYLCNRNKKAKSIISLFEREKNLEPTSPDETESARLRGTHSKVSDRVQEKDNIGEDDESSETDTVTEDEESESLSEDEASSGYDSYCEGGGSFQQHKENHNRYFERCCRREMDRFVTKVCKYIAEVEQGARVAEDKL